MVVGALILLICPAGNTALSIVEKSSGAHDLQIGAFSGCQAFDHFIDPQNVIEAMDGIIFNPARPGASSINGRHRYNSWINRS
jgi:hypothetical protein